MPRRFLHEEDKSFQVRWKEADPDSEPVVSIHFVDYDTGEKRKMLFEPEMARRLVDLLNYALENIGE